MSQVVLNMVFARVTYCASTPFQEEKDQVEQCIQKVSTFKPIGFYREREWVFAFTSILYMSVGRSLRLNSRHRHGPFPASSFIEYFFIEQILVPLRSTPYFVLHSEHM